MSRALQLALGAALVVLGAACGEDAPTGRAEGGRGGPGGGGRAGGDRPIPVRAETVERGTFRGELALVGELEGPEAVEVASEIGGRLETVEVRMGDRVRRGALLATVDDADLRAQLAETRAAYEVASASIERAQADLRRVQVELARKAPLADDDLITRQEMDDVRSRNEAAEASLEVARAQAAQATAKTRILSQKVSEARLVSSFDGWVAARYLDPGAVVAAGTKVLKLVRTDPIVARFQVSERHVGAVRDAVGTAGTQVTVTVPAYPGERFVGTVERVSPTVDSASRAAWAEAEVPNPDGRLMPGMYCRVALALGEEREALLVSSRALARDAAGEDRAGLRRSKLYVVEGEVARERQVTIGAEEGGRVEVVDGVSEGDRVVVEGQSRLRDGARIEVLRPGGSARAPALDGGPASR